MVITFSPHEEEFARKILDGIVQRVAKEGRTPKRSGSVLFAVMQMTAHIRWSERFQSRGNP